MNADYCLNFAIDEITTFLSHVFQAFPCYSLLEFSIPNLCGEFCGKGTVEEIIFKGSSHKKIIFKTQNSSIDHYSVSAVSVCRVELFESDRLPGVEIGLF